MQTVNKTYWKTSSLLFLALLLLVLYDLTFGSYTVSLKDLFNGLFNYDATSTHEVTVRIFRFPRVITAVLAGAALSISGLLMKTLFQNPLSGPYVLGIKTVTYLQVALSTMSSFHIVGRDIGLVTSSIVGATVVGVGSMVSTLYVA